VLLALREYKETQDHKVFKVFKEFKGFRETLVLLATLVCKVSQAWALPGQLAKQVLWDQPG
jgi:hypothetical protein